MKLRKKDGLGQHRKEADEETDIVANDPGQVHPVL